MLFYITLYPQIGKSVVHYCNNFFLKEVIILHSHLTAFISLISTSGVLNLFLCVYIFRKRHTYNNIAKFFVLYTTFIAIYCFGAAFGLLSTNLAQMKFWTIIQYVGMPFSSSLGLLFVMSYLGNRVTLKKCMALLAIPFISLVMVATNDLHHFHYRVFEVDPILGMPFIQIEIGVWYIVHGVFTFGSMLAAFLFVLSSWKETAKSYRPQLVALLLGQFIPIMTAFLYLIGATTPGVDPVPMVLWVSSLLYLWSINSSRMFSVMPIAKSSIFNSIGDGVIVLDERYQVIEFNEAAKLMFPSLNKTIFGVNFDTVWMTVSGKAFPFKLDTQVLHEELALNTENENRTLQLRTSYLEEGSNRKGLLLIFTDFTELKRLQVQLQFQAFHDELTQIYNRRAFIQMSELALTEAKSIPSPYTLMLIDIDFFKRINDTYGHDIGDEVLKHIVRVCKIELGEEILFARYGGEEFVLSMKGTVQHGRAIAEQLRQHIAAKPLIVQQDSITITISCGVAEWFEEDETLYQLLKKADEALYVAKRNGRNQVQVYNPLKTSM